MISRIRGRDNEKGATIVEAAIAFSVLFLAMFALIEFGLAFKDWLSVSHAAREGARAGATFGTDPSTDILVLREVEGVMAPIGLPTGSQVEIFEAAPAGASTTYSYLPGSDCGTAAGWTGSPNPLPGCCDWTPCPEPGRPTYSDPNWLPAARDVEAPGTDRIGVRVIYTHQWITGYFNPTSDFTSATDFQLEPEVFAPSP